MIWLPQSPDLSIKEAVWDYMTRPKTPRQPKSTEERLLRTTYLSSTLKNCTQVHLGDLWQPFLEAKGGLTNVLCFVWSSTMNANAQ